MKPSIRSLARLAGVSTATVSLALRNVPRISVSMREKIQRLAREQGYTSNPVVSRVLSRYRSGSPHLGTLAFVHTSANPGDHELESVRTWLRFATKRAMELGYQVDTFALGKNDITPGRLAGILEARGIQGLLLAGPFRHNTIPREFSALWKNAACVVLGERPLSPALSCVLNDQFATARQAMEEILARGYARPGLCLHPDLDGVLEGRFRAGYLLGREPLPARIPVFDFTPAAERSFVEWVRQWNPDAILTLHPEILFWCRSAGFSSIGLAHLDISSPHGRWAGMQQDNEHVGSAAVELLIGQLHFHTQGVPAFQQCLQLGSRWRNGPSLPQRRPAKG